MRWIPLVASLVLATGCDDLEGLAGSTGEARDAGRPAGVAIAKCMVTVGQVEVRRAGTDDWVPVSAGAELERGDLVRTAKESFISVKFKSGGGFDLEENGLMVISVQAAPASPVEPHKKVEQPLLALESGVGRGFIDEGDALLVPLVIQEDDGSQVSLSAAGRASFRLSKTARGTEVAVSEGKLVLSSRGKQIHVAKGQAADVAKGGSVSEVVELLDFPPSLRPGIDARIQCTPGLSVGLKWGKVNGAVGYRVQVGRDLNFQAIVVNAAVAGTESSFSPPGPGMYAWRVATRDSKDRTGEYGFARRIFCEQEAPADLLLSPGAATSYAYDEGRPPNIPFSWQSAGGATSYRLVVARQADLLATPPIVDRKVAGQREEIADLEIGEYYWGVYVDGAQPVPIFTTPRRLSVVKTLKTRFQTPKSISKWGKRK